MKVLANTKLSRKSSVLCITLLFCTLMGINFDAAADLTHGWQFINKTSTEIIMRVKDYSNCAPTHESFNGDILPTPTQPVLVRYLDEDGCGDAGGWISFNYWDNKNPGNTPLFTFKLTTFGNGTYSLDNLVIYDNRYKIRVKDGVDPVKGNPISIITVSNPHSPHITPASKNK